MSAHVQISVGQHTSAGRKNRNDDSFGVLVPEPMLLETKGIAIAIADGMSSSEAAKQASEMCVRSFLDDYYATHQSWTVKTSVERVLSAANRWLHSQSETHYASSRGMVTTFSGLVLKSSTAYVFHVGDSRIYLLRGSELKQLTTDHRIRVTHDQEHLSRAFGIARDLAVDYQTFQIAPGDIFIFTTDGIHDHLRDSQMVSLIQATPYDLDGAAERIVTSAFNNGSGDNLTCQIVRIEDVGANSQNALPHNLAKLPFPRELAPGSSFEGYKIIRELHLSKRTQVYLASDNDNGGLVAIKTPSVNFDDDATYIEMFTREEWVGNLVSSPHVLKVLPPNRRRQSLYYVTEYIEGQTLRQWMLDHPVRNLETVRNIVEQIAKGLRAFHRKEILHRDLKPENILIDGAGTIKIIDFGSARVAGVEEIQTLNERPTLVGTEGYTAPEYHQGQPPTTRSDIFSCGVITYELLTGRLPYGRGFSGPRDVDRLRYIPAHCVNPDIPTWIDAAVAKAVDKNPVCRPEMLSELVEDIRKPNAVIAKGQLQPLIERKPMAIWRGLALFLALANILLLFRT